MELHSDFPLPQTEKLTLNSSVPVLTRAGGFKRAADENNFFFHEDDRVTLTLKKVLHSQDKTEFSPFSYRYFKEEDGEEGWGGNADQISPGKQIWEKTQTRSNPH